MLYKVGDSVEQAINTKTIPKGTRGIIFSRHNGIRAPTRCYYEVEFQLKGATAFRLRYENELVATLPVGALQGGPPLPNGAPAFVRGDFVKITKLGDVHDLKTGCVTSVSPGVQGASSHIYNVEFSDGSSKMYYENNLTYGNSKQYNPQAQQAATNAARNMFGGPITKQVPDHLRGLTPESVTPFKSGKKQCVCPMQGPDGLLAKGCRCGGA